MSTKELKALKLSALFCVLLILVIPISSNKTNMFNKSLKIKKTFFQTKEDLNACKEEFKKGILSKHNEYRLLHQVGNLSWDDNLENSSYIYSSYINKISQMVHSSESFQNNIGENLYLKGSLKIQQLEPASCKGKN